MPRQTTPVDPLHLEQFLPYRLSVLANIVSATIAAAYAEKHQLSIPEWRVIAVLAREPGLSAAEVAERTAMDKVAVSRAVAGLLRRHRVVRSKASADRRRSHLELSAEGVAVYRQVVPSARRYQRALLRALSTEEAHLLDSVLAKLLDRARGLATPRIIRANTH